MQMMLHERTGTALGVAGVIYRAEGVRGFWRGNGAHSSAVLYAAMLEILQSSQLLPAKHIYALREPQSKKHIYALREPQSKVSGYSWAEPIARSAREHCALHHADPAHYLLPSWPHVRGGAAPELPERQGMTV